jgi:hypothetical protein
MIRGSVVPRFYFTDGVITVREKWWLVIDG